MKYRRAVHHLKAAGYSVREIVAPDGGRAAITTIGGRIFAFQVNGVSETIFRSNPQIANHALLRHAPGKLIANIGGLHLWFAPEYAFNWKGKPDALRFSNYVVQKGYDPARWVIVDAGKQHVRLKLTTTLRDWRDDSRIKFRVERVVSYVPPPEGVEGLHYMGIRLQHRIELLEAKPGKRVELWHLLQMPVGSCTLIPTRVRPKPLVYFNAQGLGSWKFTKNALVWRYTGCEEAKIGLDVAQVTGRAGVLRPLPNNQFAVVIWQFPVAHGMTYTDGPNEALAHNQIVQAWDGFGFGELECHSPSVSLDDPVYADHSLLWCFVGTFERVNGVAKELMNRTWTKHS
jgi:hypothetical protein